MINDNYRRSYRKQGAVKNMIKLIKEVLQGINSEKNGGT